MKNRYILPLLLVVFSLLWVQGVQGAPDKEVVSSSSTPPEIHYLTVEGVVNPVMAEFISKSIVTAEDAGAGVIVMALDTPGGLDLSMRDIVKAILASEVPVVVYVSPGGARAASAGVFIAYAAHISAMAPGTNMGSAHPVQMGGGEMDETMTKKVENDAVAYIKSLAAKHGRNIQWAEKAVRESVNITADEALELGVIDMVAENREELISKIDGMKVQVVMGEITLNTKGALIKEVEMNLRSRVLKAISDPNIAYILMMIGMLGIYFELSNPGVILPGVVGAICLVLAFYALQTLPVNYAGLILIVLAVVFFIAEVQVVSFGLLTIAGLVSLTLGSLMLFESSAPFMALSIWVLIPTVVIVAAACVGIMYSVVTSRRQRPVSGLEALKVDSGVVADEIDTDVEGHVFIEGEYWRAVSTEPLKKGDKVRVVAVDGLILKVEKS